MYICFALSSGSSVTMYACNQNSLFLIIKGVGLDCECASRI